MQWAVRLVLVAAVGTAACASAGSGDDDDDSAPDAAPGQPDAASSQADAASSQPDAASGTPDAAPGTPDAAPGPPDATPTPDAPPPPPDAAPPPPDAGGIITGGPCMSGAAGATAFRLRWGNAGGDAYVIYEANGLPDPDDHAGAYGYVIGFTPSYVDTFLAEGGLQLNSSSFVDIELSTVGLSSITTATLSLYGRSYHTTTSGSFNWQTFEGTGASPSNSVANSAPYEWYSADMTTEISPGDDGVLLRIKAGPSSGSLVVHRIEICMVAD